VADATAAARQAGVKINTIAFGTQNGELDLGGSSIGVDPAELERQLGIVLAKVVDVRVSLHMAGSGSVHSNAPRVVRSGGSRWGRRR